MSPLLQVFNHQGISVSWGVPLGIAAFAMVAAGVIIGLMTIKGVSTYIPITCRSSWSCMDVEVAPSYVLLC